LHGEGILVIQQEQTVVFTGRGEGRRKGMTRTEREIQTVRKMIDIYCHHGGGKTLCEECLALCAYAEQRVEKCPFGEEKPACGQCPIHCYKPQMKEKIGRVMRFSGPKMIYRHPVLALRHLIAKHAPIAPPAIK
jgi:hypothetical protein